MKFTYYHCNINVFDLEKSIAFYEKALGLQIEKRKKASDGSYEIVYMTDGAFSIELTWLRDKKSPYNLGDNESHIAFKVDDYDAGHALHEEMGCICYENGKLGLYFINDPDGYWLEILPQNRGDVKH